MADDIAEMFTAALGLADVISNIDTRGHPLLRLA